jgi:hypothetical protein
VSPSTRMNSATPPMSSFESGGDAAAGVGRLAARRLAACFSARVGAFFFVRAGFWARVRVRRPGVRAAGGGDVAGIWVNDGGWNDVEGGGGGGLAV